MQVNGSYHNLLEIGLPDEIVGEIVNYLPIVDINALSQASKKLYELFKGNEDFWKHIARRDEISLKPRKGVKGEELYSLTIPRLFNTTVCDLSIVIDHLDFPRCYVNTKMPPQDLQVAVMAHQTKTGYLIKPVLLSTVERISLVFGHAAARSWENYPSGFEKKYTIKFQKEISNYQGFFPHSLPFKYLMNKKDMDQFFIKFQERTFVVNCWQELELNEFIEIVTLEQGVEEIVNLLKADQGEDQIQCQLETLNQEKDCYFISL